MSGHCGRRTLLALTLVLALGSQIFFEPTRLARRVASRPGAVAAAAPAAAGFRGMAYGPFRAGQSPDLGIYPTLEQVREDMGLLAPVASAIRTYGCQHLETVVTATHEIGLPLALGVWLTGNAERDAAEADCAVAQAQRSPRVVSIIAGNESVQSGRLDVAGVCAHVADLRERTGLPVTTAEPWHVWIANPELADCVDYMTVHIHPYWECQMVESAVGFVQEKYQQVRADYPTIPLVIGEAGWPSAGTGREGQCGPMPLPSPEQQSLFAAGFVTWARQEGVSYYFFDAFDEPWKCGNGGAEVECHWGIYTTDRLPKPARQWFVAYHTRLPILVKGQPER